MIRTIKGRPILVFPKPESPKAESLDKLKKGGEVGKAREKGREGQRENVEGDKIEEGPGVEEVVKDVDNYVPKEVVEKDVGGAVEDVGVAKVDEGGAKEDVGGDKAEDVGGTEPTVEGTKQVEGDVVGMANKEEGVADEAEEGVAEEEEEKGEGYMSPEEVAAAIQSGAMVSV